MNKGKYEREVFGGRKSVSIKSAAILLTLVLVLSTVIGGTLAWLMDETDPVTNTFTVGDIKIDLKETTGPDYKIIPGGSSDKNPEITVENGSEACYVYVLIENNLVLDEVTVGTPDINEDDWEKVTSAGNKTLYRYKESVDAAAEEKVIGVFTKVTYDGDRITKENIVDLKGKTIVITAFAHQSANTDADTADANIKAKAGLTQS